MSATATPEPPERELRYALQVKPRGRGNHRLQLVAVFADLGDAEYLASAYRDMNGMSATVVDLAAIRETQSSAR